MNVTRKLLSVLLIVSFLGFNLWIVPNHTYAGLFGGIGKALKGAFKAFKKAIGSVVNAISSAINSVVSTISGALGGLKSIMGDIGPILALVSTVAAPYLGPALASMGSVGSFLSGAVNVVSQVSTFLNNPIGTAMNFLGQTSFGQSVMGFLSNVGSVGELVNNAIGQLSSTFANSSFASFVGNVGNTLNSLAGNFQNMVGQFSQIGNSLLNSMNNFNLGNVLDVAKQFGLDPKIASIAQSVLNGDLAGAMQNLGGSWSKAYSVVEGLMTGDVTPLVEVLPSNAQNVIKDIAKKLEDGVITGNEALDAIMAVLPDDLKGKVKDILDVKMGKKSIDDLIKEVPGIDVNQYLELTTGNIADMVLGTSVGQTVNSVLTAMSSVNPVIYGAGPGGKVAVSLMDAILPGISEAIDQIKQNFGNMTIKEVIEQVANDVKGVAEEDKDTLQKVEEAKDEAKQYFKE